MSTDPLAGYALIGTMMVDSSEKTAVSSADAATPFELLQGLSYKAKAAGVVQVQKLTGTGTPQLRQADAEYVRGVYPRALDGQYVLGNNWLDGGANGEWGLGLKLNGEPADVAWTPAGYQSSHEYYYDLGVAGVDGPLKAKYFDPTGSYKDEDDQTGGGDDGNVGSFTVEVWQAAAGIDAPTINLNQAGDLLAQDKEETDGAFVPVNSDDDDYTAVPGGADGADKSQSGAIDGENDLLPVNLTMLDAGVGGKWKLTIPNHIKVYEKADRSTPITATTQIDAAATKTIYIEGVSAGTGLLKINWTDGETTLNDIDRIKITTFEWSGPLNVPGYAIYNYKASGAANGKWIAPEGGTIKKGANTSDMDILWGSGPVVGKAKYQAAEGYVWGLDVNVVSVLIGTTNQITYRNSPVQDNTAKRKIRSVSSSNKPAMKAELTIDVTGPIVNNKARGVDFIEVGYIQNVRAAAIHGDYDQLPKTNSTEMGRKRVSSLEDGKYHLDTTPTSTSPWYQSDPNALFAPGSPQNVTGKSIEVRDTPQVFGTDVFVVAENGKSDRVDRFDIIIDFNLYLSVRTKSSSNDADAVYTQRGKAKWQFDGSGTVNAQGRWTLTGSGNTGDNVFTEVKDGSVVPITAGTTMNDLAAKETWSTEDQ